MAVTDSDIITTMKGNPEKGFRMLMSSYSQPIYWHIRRLVVSHADAQDAAQETFVKVFRHFSQFNPDNSLAAWIFKIATNEALRLLSRHSEERLSLDDAMTELKNVFADSYTDYSDLETVKLRDAILSLPTKQQIAFNLRYYDELAYEEIAEIAGSSVSAVKTNYHIAKEKIIQYMNSHD